MVIQPLSTRLIKPNFCFDLSHRRSTTVSLETRNSNSRLDWPIRQKSPLFGLGYCYLRSFEVIGSSFGANVWLHVILKVEISAGTMLLGLDEDRGSRLKWMTRKDLIKYSKYWRQTPYSESMFYILQQGSQNLWRKVSKVYLYVCFRAVNPRLSKCKYKLFFERKCRQFLRREN